MATKIDDIGTDLFPGQEYDPEFREKIFRRDGSPDSEARFKALCERALTKQATKYAVAPGMSVSTCKGGIRGPYEAVESWMVDDGSHPTELVMLSLVQRGIVLEKADL